MNKETVKAWARILEIGLAILFLIGLIGYPNQSLPDIPGNLNRLLDGEAPAGSSTSAGAKASETSPKKWDIRDFQRDQAVLMAISGQRTVDASSGTPVDADTLNGLYQRIQTVVDHYRTIGRLSVCEANSYLHMSKSAFDNKDFGALRDIATVMTEPGALKAIALRKLADRPVVFISGHNGHIVEGVVLDASKTTALPFRTPDNSIPQTIAAELKKHDLSKSWPVRLGYLLVLVMLSILRRLIRRIDIVRSRPVAELDAVSEFRWYMDLSIDSLKLKKHGCQSGITTGDIWYRLPYLEDVGLVLIIIASVGLGIVWCIYANPFAPKFDPEMQRFIYDTIRTAEIAMVKL